MSVAKDCWHTLSARLRLEVLRQVAPTAATAPENFKALELDPADHGRLSLILTDIAILTDESAEDRLRDALTDAGWNEDTFATSQSGYERAGWLRVTNAKAAEKILVWLNFEQLRNRESICSRFQYDSKLELRDDWEQLKPTLKGLIGAALKEAKKTHDIVEVHIEWLPPSAARKGAAPSIQIVVLVASDPQSFRVVVGGQVVSVAHRLASDLIIHFDPEESLIEVISEKGGLALRKEVARCAHQVLFGIAVDLKAVQPARVYPAGLVERPTFSCKLPLKSVHVTSVSYRRNSNTDLKVKLERPPGEDDVYSAPELSLRRDEISVFSGELSFLFLPRGQHAGARTRRGRLTGPNMLSLNRFTPFERDLANAALRSARLLAPAAQYTSRASLSILDALLQPQSRKWTVARLGESLCDALHSEKIVRPGPGIDRPDCDICQKSHDILWDGPDGLPVLDCMERPRALTEDDMQSCVCDAAELARWLRTSLKTDGGSGRKLGEHLWDLGVATHLLGKGKLRIWFAMRADSTAALHEMIERINTHGGRDGGLLISSGAMEKTRIVAPRWQMEPLDRFMIVEGTKLAIDTPEVERAVTGKAPRKRASKVASWPEILAAAKDLPAGKFSADGAEAELKMIIPDVTQHYKDGSIARKLRDEKLSNLRKRD